MKEEILSKLLEELAMYKCARGCTDVEHGLKVAIEIVEQSIAEDQKDHTKDPVTIGMYEVPENEVTRSIRQQFEPNVPNPQGPITSMLDTRWM